MAEQLILKGTLEGHVSSASPGRGSLFDGLVDDLVAVQLICAVGWH